ncbi:MAG: class I SAM-dependent methyltransferase [Anaerohalosphaera sp.]|nr:class I SAM-dependent methyltransferase [Anaerohalosphaera sp.]
MSILNKIIETVRKPNAEPDIINKVKGFCAHKSRGCHYGRWRLKVDSLVSESVPGVTETIVNELNKIKGDQSLRLLNLGGGIGQLSSIFEFIGFDVINTDIGIEQPDEKNIQIDFNKCTELPFPDNSFDCIVCQEVIEHVENPWNIFRLAHRYLKAGGKFFLTTPNIHSFKSKRIFQKENYFRWFTPKDHSYHINPIPVWEIKLIAEKTGFSIDATKGNADFFFGNTDDTDNIRNIMAKNDALIFVLGKSDTHQGTNWPVIS